MSIYKELLGQNPEFDAIVNSTSKKMDKLIDKWLQDHAEKRKVLELIFHLLRHIEDRQWNLIKEVKKDEEA